MGKIMSLNLITVKLVFASKELILNSDDKYNIYLIINHGQLRNGKVKKTKKIVYASKT